MVHNKQSYWEEIYVPADYCIRTFLHLLGFIPFISMILLLVLLINVFVEKQYKHKNFNLWILLFGNTKTISKRLSKYRPNFDICKLNQAL